MSSSLWIRPSWSNRSYPSSKIELPTNVNTITCSNKLQKNGYVVIKNLFGSGSLDLLEKEFYDSSCNRYRADELNGVKRILAHNQPTCRLFHSSLLNLMKSITGEDLKLSYCLIGLYERGSCLPVHRDSREACKWNISLYIKSNPELVGQDWNLNFYNPKKKSVKLNEGDVVIYSGTEIDHGRDDMPDNLDTYLGAFFHFTSINYDGSLD